MSLKEDLMAELQKLRIGRETIKIKQQKQSAKSVKASKTLEELKQLLDEVEEDL